MIVVKPREIRNVIDWNPADSKYYHIQIHFKRTVKGSKGSIEFDCDKTRIMNFIVDFFRCRERIEVEDREFNAANISRASICRTEESKKDPLNKVLGPKSQKFDYLMEIAKPTDRWKIETKIVGCRSLKEWFKINWLLLIVPTISGFTSIMIGKVILDWSYQEVLAIALPIIGLGLGLGKLLQREL